MELVTLVVALAPLVLRRVLPRYRK